MALGGSSEASKKFSIAEGYLASSDGYGAIAIGSAAKIKQLEKGTINHIVGNDNKGLYVDADGNVTKITVRTESEKDILSRYGQTYGAVALGLDLLHIIFLPVHLERFLQPQLLKAWQSATAANQRATAVLLLAVTAGLWQKKVWH